MQAQKIEENENLKMTLRKEGRKRTYSNGDSDWVDLVYALSRVQWWTPLEKLMRFGSGDLKKSQRKKRVRDFREMMARVRDFR